MVVAKICLAAPCLSSSMCSVKGINVQAVLEEGMPYVTMVNKCMSEARRRPVK